MKNKLICILLAVCTSIIIPLTAAGCDKTDDKVIRINEVTHSVFYAPMYLADALGYFGEEGYEIELTNGGGADNTMAAVVSGNADIGFCGPEAALYVQINGSKDAPKVFGQLTKRDGSFLVSRKNEPDFKWSNLQGKDILAGRDGGVPAMTFAYVLKEEGVTATLNSAVEFNSMTAAFEGNVGDYCTMFEPVASEYEAAGKGYVVASVGEKSGEIPYTCYIAKDSFMKAHPEKIDALLRSVTRAIKYIKTTDDDTIANLLVPYFDGTSLASIKTSVKNYKAIDAWVDNMAMQESAYNRLLDVIDYSGKLARRLPFGDLILTEDADRIYREIYA